MREQIKDSGRIQHMLTAIENIEEFTSGISHEEFINSKILFFAVVKNIEIIGEATYMLTPQYKQAHNIVPWQIIEKMRHVLVHGYYTISAETIWETIQNDIPMLKEQIMELISSK